MTDTDSSTAGPRRAPRAGRTARPEGQWALGQTEPLNANEAWKARRGRARGPRPRPLDVRDRRASPRSTRQRPARPDALVGPVHPAPAGDRRRPHRHARARASSTTSTSCCGSASTAAGSSLAQLRDARRHLHAVRPRHRRRHRPAEHPVPLDPDRGRARDLGRGSRRSACTTTEACGDTPRVDPRLARRRCRRRRDHRRHAGDPRDLRRRYVGDPEFANLPRKFKTAITRQPAPGRRPRDQRRRLRRRRPPRARPGLRPLGRRRAVDQPDARPSGSARGCPLEEVAEVWHGVIRIFRDYGYRRLRNRARLKFLVADWGAGEVPRGARDRVPRPPARRRPRPAAAAARPHATTSGVHQQSDGRFYVGVAPVVGRVSGDAAARPRRRRRARRLATGSGSPRSRRSSSSTSRPRRSPTSSTTSRRSACPPGPSTFRRGHDGLHRHRVLQARDRRDEGRRRRTSSPSSSGASPTSPSCSRRTPPRSPSTSTAARTRAPAHRSPTSGSRASSSRTRTTRRPPPSRASRSTSAAASASRPASAASCAGSRRPAPTCRTTSSASSAAGSSSASDGETFAAWVARADEADLA